LGTSDDLSEPTIYEQPSEIVTSVRPDGWALIRRSGDPMGIALDRAMFAIWSAAGGHTAAEAAQIARVSTYLASCAIAVLQHAGLLSGAPQAQAPSSGGPAQGAVWPSISAVFVHHSAKADLGSCVDSVLEQEFPAVSEITVVASADSAPQPPRGRLVTCDHASLARRLIEHVDGGDAELLLLLDSQVRLAPGSLAEMARAFGLPGGVAAVTPRIMWDQWPQIVAHLGDWRDRPDSEQNPYAGHLDVGQFERRWHEVPAAAFPAGLIDGRSLRQVGVLDAECGLGWMGVDWCKRARKCGYHILGAAQALAYGPWPEGEPLAQTAQGQASDRDDEGGDLPSPGPGPMMHDGMPAITMDSVRSMYSQYPAITPISVQRRVALVTGETERHKAMARALSAQHDVSWMVPRILDEEALRSSCETADLVITTARLLERMAFLQGWHRPIVVDMQPPITAVESGEPWPQAVDGLVCASEEERQHWLEKLALHSPRASQDNGRLDELLTVVPTGVERVASPSELDLQNLHPEIQPDDKIILWYGSLLGFEDPLTAIHATAELRRKEKGVKLIFTAFDGEKQDEESITAAVRLVAKLSLQRSVLFARQVATDLRSSYLADADLALMLGTDTLEAKLHEPAGLTACIGAGLPMVITAGCSGSSQVQRYGLGETVPAGDVAALAGTLGRILQTQRTEYEERFEKARRARAWPVTMEPLAALCQQQRFALEREASPLLHIDMLLPEMPEATSLRDLPTKTWQTFSRLGVRSTIRKVVNYVRWKTGT
jgi:glycosyltransferase involved in cell wall biosynthesis